MWTKIRDFLLKRPIGRFIAVGLLIVAVAYGVRLYYVDLPKHEAANARLSGLERLETMADALEEAISDAEDRDAFVDSLPTRTSWYPADLACGTSAPHTSARPEIWTMLGLPEKGETSFEYRFDRREDAIILRARRDADCDGLHAIHTLRASTSLTSLAGRKTTSENVHE